MQQPESLPPAVPAELATLAQTIVANLQEHAGALRAIASTVQAVSARTHRHLDLGLRMFENHLRAGPLENGPPERAVAGLNALAEGAHLALQRLESRADGLFVRLSVTEAQNLVRAPAQAIFEAVVSPPVQALIEGLRQHHEALFQHEADVIARAGGDLRPSGERVLQETAALTQRVRHLETRFPTAGTALRRLGAALELAVSEMTDPRPPQAPPSEQQAHQLEEVFENLRADLLIRRSSSSEFARRYDDLLPALDRLHTDIRVLRETTDFRLIRQHGMPPPPPPPPRPVSAPEPSPPSAEWMPVHNAGEEGLPQFLAVPQPLLPESPTPEPKG